MIRAHEEPEVLTLDVEGPATMVDSLAVQAMAKEQLACGLREMRVDLRSCTVMDSTFSGTLLGLQRQLDSVGGTLTLVSPSPKVMELLEQMGLEDFYVIEARARANGAAREISGERPDVEELKRLVLDAHDELSRLPGPAGDAFREVAEELRRCDPTDEVAGV